MRETARTIHEQESLVAIEGRTASVKDIFDLVGNAELEEAEKRYLPNRPRPNVIILAASGSSLGELTRERPKCMVDIRGQSLLQRLTSTLKEGGAGEVTVVRGYKKEAVQLKGIKTLDNDRYAETGELFSLSKARSVISGETIISYGDILFRRFIVDGLMASDADIVLAVDAVGPSRNLARTRDLVTADRPFSNNYLDETSANLQSISSDMALEKAQGEWMGLARLSAKGSQWVLEEMADMEKEGLLEKADLPMLFTRIAKKHPVRIEYFTGHWMDVDDLRDLADARNFT
jgi:phosphoenolpyruvate phosphomutase